MTNLTYLSSLIASLVSGGSDDQQPNFLSRLIVSFVSGGSDDHPNIFK